MQHPVMRAPETELGQHVVGIADEVAIGEEQELDDVPGGLGRAGAALCARCRPVGDI